MTKTPSTTALTTFILTASIEGLERVTVDIRNNCASRSPAFQDNLATLMDNDLVDKSVAKLSAAEESGVAGYDPSWVIGSSDDDVLSAVHALNTRLTSLPPEQQGEIGDYLFSDAIATQFGIVGGVDLEGLSEAENESDSDEL